METERAKLIQFFCQTGLVSQPQAMEMASTFRPYQLPKNAFLLEEGQQSDTYLFLDNGFMRSYAIDPKGNEITTGFFAPGQLVFEPGSFFRQIPSKEFIQALEPCTGWELNFKELNGLFHARQEFREFGRAMLVGALVSTKARMLSMITDTAEERYLQLLKRNPEILQHAPLKYIATYLGVTDTSLSRIRKEVALH
jgi:CRP-like cAMP-binding protein